MRTTARGCRCAASSCRADRASMSSRSRTGRSGRWRRSTLVSRYWRNSMPVLSEWAPADLFNVAMNEWVSFGRSSPATAGALIAGDVEAGEPADAVRNRRVVRCGEPQARQIEVVVRGIRIGAAHEPVVAVADVHDRARRQHVDVVERDLARDELEPFAGGQVAEVVVVVAVAIVPAHAREHPLLVGDVVVDADGVVGVLDVFRQRRVAGSCWSRRGSRRSWDAR